ncbi:transmembrane protein, putative [Medicago truncatula]|uniref:Transmembrane protein, putative n=1 Tax=Medicago truncatula TaxID=3880 RepID=G7KEP3_MEDTR|nr:transmembrane protein, putative [Medicago truncatula]
MTASSLNVSTEAFLISLTFFIFSVTNPYCAAHSTQLEYLYPIFKHSTTRVMSFSTLYKSNI